MMMELKATTVSSWPKLAWVATLTPGSSEIQVLHGPVVEVGDGWIAEAVWAGDFQAGDFDQTDLVFGSGIRCRGDRVVFVSSGTTFDRLWRCSHGEKTHVSNSLSALLAVSGLELRDDYPDYSRDVQTICAGLANRISSIPLRGGDATCVYFNNLTYDGNTLAEEPKPDPAPAFCTYEDYYGFLVRTAERLGSNLADLARTRQIVPVSGVSSGYDSCAAAVISRHAGCGRTVTIRDSTSLWRGSDSGEPIARRLGMSCVEYPRTASHYPMEPAIWAGEGHAGIVNWTLFGFPTPLCLFFTGWHGEKMWDRVCHDHPDPFVRRDTGSLSFCEWRLLQGVFQCPVPFWAARHNHQTRAITLSEAMVPWYTNKDYDKPIARRIVEEAGVPRRLFGMLKKNSSHEEAFRWPYSPDARASFAQYRRQRGKDAPSDRLLRTWQLAAHGESLAYMNLFAKLGIRKRFRPWLELDPDASLFTWANGELRALYARGLASQPRSGR